MKVLNWISCVLLAAAVVVADVQPTELQVETTYVPPECKKKTSFGDRIVVHYTGTLYKTGAKFDSSLDRGQPFPFTLGSGQVIPGWDQGLQHMCVKEKRRLTIPPTLAYGSRGFGSIIPPNSALVFEVEMLLVESRDEL